MKKKLVKEKLITYIREGLSKGYSTEEIKAKLEESGVKPKEIEQAITTIQKKEQKIEERPEKIPTTPKSVPSKKKFFLIISGLILALIVVGIIIFNISTSKEKTIIPRINLSEEPTTIQGEPEQISMYHFCLAMAKQDESYCEKGGKMYCTKNVKAIKPLMDKSMEELKKILSESLLETLIKGKESEYKKYCEKKPSPNCLNMVYQLAAMFNKNPSLCEKISDKKLAIICTASVSKNSEECEIIKT